MEKEELMSKDYKECITEYQSDPFTEGRLVTEIEAKGMMDEYFSRLGTPGPPQEVYGFVLGLDKLKALMDKIISHNSTKPDQIRGIRFYKTYDRRPTPANPRGLINILGVPVNENCKDMLEINPYEKSIRTGVEEPIIIAEPRPCPNQCEKK